MTSLRNERTMYRPPGAKILEPPHELRNGFFFEVHEGLRVFLRPVLPEDRDPLTEGFAGLSQRSRYYRFFACRNHLTDRELHYFTEVDQLNHIAWIAFDTSRPRMHSLGLCRFIRDKNDATAAEFAVTVVDAYQHQGLGTILLAVLFLRAEAVGIHRLRACVLPENLVVIRWLRSLGVDTPCQKEYLELELKTGLDRSKKPGTPSWDKFVHLLAAIRQAAPAALLNACDTEGV